MSVLALSPVSEAVYARLNVSAVTSLATGGISDDPAQGTAFPFVWYEVDEEESRGFGTGGLPQVNLRVHVFSQYEGGRDAQLVMAQVITRLKDVALTVTGYTACGHAFYDRTVPLSHQMLNGIKVHELVSDFRIFMEAA